jgi:hypothetical protein
MAQTSIDAALFTQFFSGYLVDHFICKMYTLYNALEKLQELKPELLDGLENISDAEYQSTLRLEIRATYFQAIETLFELVFSLEPRAKIIDNRQIWYHLSTSKGKDNYKLIDSIAKGDTSFLDRPVVAGRQITIPYIQYLFYFGVTNSTMLDTVSASNSVIKKFLIAFAQEFSDHAEYNAFKHALRIFPTMKTVEIGPQGSDTPLVTLDMGTSMTFMVVDKKTITFKTKHLEIDRDMRMGGICAQLISNIVRSRRAHFTDNKEGNLYTYTDESFSSANLRDGKWTEFNFSIQPI